MENLACILLLPVSYKPQILEITPEKLSPFNIALTAIMKSSILYKILPKVIFLLVSYRTKFSLKYVMWKCAL